jgi:hypothetical protein
MREDDFAGSRPAAAGAVPVGRRDRPCWDDAGGEQMPPSTTVPYSALGVSLYQRKAYF